MFSIVSNKFIITNSIVFMLFYPFGYLSMSIIFLVLSYLSEVISFLFEYTDSNIDTVCKKETQKLNNEDTNDVSEKENDSDQIVISECMQYYTYKGIHYDIAFPLFWVLYEHPDRGPYHCENCKDYGSFRGVFIMYCMNCASEYESEGYNVGYGAINSGVEECGNDASKTAWNTYLKYRQLDCIGLPEELEKIDFNREGYRYELTSYEDEFGNSWWYPDFVSIDSEDNEYEDDEDDEDDTYYNNQHEYYKYYYDEEYVFDNLDNVE